LKDFIENTLDSEGTHGKRFEADQLIEYFCPTM